MNDQAGPSSMGVSSLSLHNNDYEVVVDVSDKLYMKVYPEFQQMRLIGALCDAKIVCNGRYFLAHKVVLAGAVPYFHVMFTGDFLEGHSGEINISDIDPDAFEIILDFIYTGKIEFNIKTVHELVSAADYLQFDLLSEEIANFLNCKITTLNVLELRQIARFHNNIKVVDITDRFLNKNFLIFSTTTEFLSMDEDELCELLVRDELHVDFEEQVFEAALRWLQFDENRSKKASKILSLIRMTQIEHSVLTDQVATNPILHTSISCRDLIDEAKDYHLIPESREGFRTFNLGERTCSDIPGLIYACGGLGMNIDCRDSFSKVEMFDPLAQKWFNINSMKSTRIRVGVSTLHGRLYVIGGYNGTDRLGTTEVFEPKRSSWSQCDSLQIARSAVATAVLTDNIYAIGGFDGKISLDSVEIYNFISKQWIFGPKLLAPRCAAAAAVLNGYIYVTGGHNNSAIFNSVERFDPKKGEWQMITNMRSQRCRHGLVAYRNKLYAIGGYDGHHFLRSTEIYDPLTETWSHGPDLNVRRARVGCCINGDTIYAIGGNDGESHICSMETLKLESEVNGEMVWRMGPNMKLHEGGVGIGVIQSSLRKHQPQGSARRKKVAIDERALQESD